MKVLSIETSCDETSLAIFEVEEIDTSLNFNVLSHLTNSQAQFHNQFGGVYPKMAKREHGNNIIPLFIETLRESVLLVEKETSQSINLENVSQYLDREPELKENISLFLNQYQLPKFDLIVVTNGPGLEPTLWVGINFAKTLGVLTNTPVIPSNHMEGHIVSVFPHKEKTFKIPNIEFPILSLLVSGGHTELVFIEKWGQYKKIGQTKDDAVGEAFDKVARLLGYPYPGGPEISKFASYAREQGLPNIVTLPRPMLHSKDYNFSFSGIKTAVLYTTKDKKFSIDEKATIAREFEDAVVQVLIKKTTLAIEEFGVEALIVAGGVSANNYLKQEFEKYVTENNKNLTVLFPEKNMTGDNALMIGIAGCLDYMRNKKIPPLDAIVAEGNLSL